MIRTYKHSSIHSNQVKLDKLIALSKEYKLYSNYTMKCLYSNVYKNIPVAKYPTRYDVSLLSERYKSVAGMQTQGTFKSWLSNLENSIAECINKCSLTKEEKLVLHYINTRHSWFDTNFKVKDQEVPSYLKLYIRKIFKHYKFNIPVIKKNVMMLNNNVCSVEQSKNTFDYWLKISTLERGNPVLIPIKSYDYFQLKDGKIKNAIQVTIRNNKAEFGLMKDLPVVETTNTNVVGIDLGLVKLITASSGNNYGSAFYKKIKYYDELIQNKIKKMARTGIYTSPKLLRLYQRVRDLIKNEVGRCLNRLIAIEKPKVIVTENLKSMAFKAQQSKMSRRMKRILTNAGFNQVERRLKNKCELLGIDIVKVNPAYTSQECSKCHCIDSNNRKTQSKFKCTRCGFESNADYNGSINIKSRRSISEVGIYTPYKQVKGILDTVYLSEQTPTTVGL